MDQVDVYLGLGSNLGDRLRNLNAAIDTLSAHMRILSKSHVYETEPVGFDNQPSFLNMACHATTTLLPVDVLGLTQATETAVGRFTTFQDGPRVIDIDILLYGDTCVRTDTLIIPHPAIAERLFVLVPMAEIAAHVIHPILHKSIRELLHETSDRHWVQAIQGGEDVSVVR